MPQLDRWDSFYVIVGSAAGALIGLQFVVTALVAERPVRRTAEEAGAAFATPQIVHFVTAFVLSALLRAPWQGIAKPSLIWGLIGGAGAVYALIVARRMRRQDAYRPVFEDWLFHAALPFAAYALLAATAFEGRTHPRPALFGVAGAVMALLLIAIHNAWDSAAYHVFVRRAEGRNEGAGPS